MISRTWQKRAAMILLVFYCLDLASKLVSWRDTFRNLPWWGATLVLAVRFAFMGFLVIVLIRLRKPPQGQALTSTFKNSSLREMRIIQFIFLATILGYAYVAELLSPPSSSVQPVIVGTFSILAVFTVLVVFALRGRLLPSAVEALQRGDANGVRRWRSANILSMVPAQAIGMFGLVLRTMGCSRHVAWPFFLGAIILLLVWTPRLDVEIIGLDALPPPVTK
jgi:hypothetical protein